MDLPYGPPHLVQMCSCKQMFAIEIRPDQVDLGAVELARSLPGEDVAKYVAFCNVHETAGHELGELSIAAFAPLPEA